MSNKNFHEKDKSKIDFHLIKRLLHYMRPYWLLVTVSIIFMVLAASLDLAIPYVTKVAIDNHIATLYQKYDDSSNACTALLNRYPDSQIIKTSDKQLLLSKMLIKKIPALELKAYYTNSKLDKTNYYLFPAIAQQTTKLANIGKIAGDYWLVPSKKFSKIPLATILKSRQNDLCAIRNLSLLIILFLLLNLATRYIQVITLNIAGQHAMCDLRTALFDHIQSLPLKYFNKRPMGWIVTRITNDIEALSEMFSNVLVNLLRDFLLLFGAIGILLFLNVKLALISMTIIPIFAVISLFFKIKIRSIYRQARKHLSQLNSHLAEDLSGIKIIQLFQQEKNRRDKYADTNQKYFQANFKQMIYFGTFRPLIELISTTGLALVLVFGGISVIKGVLSIGALVAFTAYIRKMFQPLTAISEKYTILQSAMAAAERTFEILDEETEIDYKQQNDKTKILGEVTFSNVNFSYIPPKQILEDLSFRIAPGKSIAIVGPTGAGKSSIINLLCRFYETDNGTIKIDNNDIAKMPLATLRNNISIVLQDAFIYSRSIRENISMGSNLSIEEVKDAAELVQIKDFIDALPNGFETIMAERGATLSTGQKQLICFARALAHDPKILILDEATSSIDPNTEQLIQQAIQRLMKGRTCLVVAHRLSTIQNADEILVIDQGRIMEQGNHEQLLKKRGIYYNLYLLQYAKK